MSEAHCQKLPSSATKEERRAAHANKMLFKEAERERVRDLAHGRRQLLKGAKAYANLSAHHPDYGCTQREHEQLKRERVTGKVLFRDKDRLRVRHGALRGVFGL